jgi:hypothetical protein
VWKFLVGDRGGEMRGRNEDGEGIGVWIYSFSTVKKITT